MHYVCLTKNEVTALSLLVAKKARSKPVLLNIHIDTLKMRCEATDGSILGILPLTDRDPDISNMPDHEYPVCPDTMCVLATELIAALKMHLPARTSICQRVVIGLKNDKPVVTVFPGVQPIDIPLTLQDDCYPNIDSVMPEDDDTMHITTYTCFSGDLMTRLCKVAKLLDTYEGEYGIEFKLVQKTPNIPPQMLFNIYDINNIVMTGIVMPHSNRITE